MQIWVSRVMGAPGELDAARVGQRISLYYCCIDAHEESGSAANDDDCVDGQVPSCSPRVSLLFSAGEAGSILGH